MFRLKENLKQSTPCLCHYHYFDFVVTTAHGWPLGEQTKFCRPLLFVIIHSANERSCKFKQEKNMGTAHVHSLTAGSHLMTDSEFYPE